MVLLTHSTVYHNTKQLGMVHLLNISTTSLTIEHQAGLSAVFLQSNNDNNN